MVYTNQQPNVIELTLFQKIENLCLEKGVCECVSRLDLIFSCQTLDSCSRIGVRDKLRRNDWLI
jgi:hypothetical protein